MNFAPITLQDETFYLRLTVGASEELQERFKSLPRVLETVATGSITELIDIFCTLAKHGELSRRYIGYDAMKLFGKTELLALLQPNDIPEIRDAVMSALIDGIGDRKNDDPVDLGLLKLNKEKPLNMSMIYYAGLKLGMNVRDIMNMPLADIFALMEEANANSRT